MKEVIAYIRDVLTALRWTVPGYVTMWFKTKVQMQAEMNLMQSQLTMFTNDVRSGKLKKPKTNKVIRMMWVLNAPFCPDAYALNALYARRTVSKWFKEAFKLYWRQKSRCTGRPPIPVEVQQLIWEIHVKNPAWSPGRIHDQLVNLNITDVPSANTIKNYLETKPPPKPKRTAPAGSAKRYFEFLKGHHGAVWGVDMFTVVTWFFRTLYVLIMIDHGTRQVIHFAVTTNPNLFWLMQQFKEATPFGEGPMYLVHDNEPIFVSKQFQTLLRDSGVKSIKTSIQAPWQNPYAERVIGSIRRELLDFNVPRNQKHLERMLGEFIFGYYNTDRTHQGIDRSTPVPSPAYPPTPMADTKLEYDPILGGQYHKLRKIG